MKNLVLLFGGQSTEHEVSCRSVLTVVRAVNKDKYRTYLIGITKTGEWKKKSGASPGCDS